MSILQQLNVEMSSAIARARAGLVQINNGQQGHGAGTIWHPDGLIITNAHVVAELRPRWGRGRRQQNVSGPALSVTLPDGRKLAASVLATDPARDLAALSVVASHLPVIALGQSRKLTPGTWVMAVGHPWGVAGAVTSGIVIGMADNLPEVPRTGRNVASGANPEWIAVSLHMRPGHSGGPLIDANGQIVGINTMIAGPDVGFAAPVHAVKRFLKEALDA